MNKVDQNTLPCFKGKFAHVCVNIDIFEPLLGSLIVSKNHENPSYYERFHNAYAWCDSEDYQIETCLMLLAQAKKEAIIEKFGGTGVSSSKAPQSSKASASPPLFSTDNWIQVSPKKRL